MKEKATLYSGTHGSGKTEMSQLILHDLYDRLLYKEVVLEVQVSYMSGVDDGGVGSDIRDELRSLFL